MEIIYTLVELAMMAFLIYLYFAFHYYMIRSCYRIAKGLFYMAFPQDDLQMKWMKMK